MNREHKAHDNIIQWVDYHKNCYEVRLKGPDYQIVIFTIDLTGRKLWQES